MTLFRPKRLSKRVHMYIIKISILIIFLSLNTAFVFAQENIENAPGFPNLEGPYLGQQTPGTTAEIFAPGIVSVNGRYEYGVSFTPDLDEIYFSGEREDGVQHVFFSKLAKNKWTRPKKANFTKGEKTNEFEAFVDHGGDKVYFAAYDSIFKDESIWCVNRVGNSWGKAKKLESPINNDIVFYPNTSENGDLFYTSISKWKMYYAPNKEGKYPKVHEVGIEYGVHGFISPSQDFILIDAQKENDRTKDRDIHVCFKKKDGGWTKPVNLGEAVNSNFDETCPSISPDGNYLFFSRYNEDNGLSNIYWVSTEVIEKVKPVDLN